jgi:hypothetical protein
MKTIFLLLYTPLAEVYDGERGSFTHLRAIGRLKSGKRGQATTRNQQ